MGDTVVLVTACIQQTPTAGRDFFPLTVNYVEKTYAAGRIPALLGASAALALSGIPFNGPIGAARVGWQDGRYVLNPTAKELAQSQLHLVVAGTEHAVLMVESEAKGLSEEVMLGAVVFGHEQMQIAIKTINEMVAAVGKPKWDWKPAAGSAELDAAVAAASQKALSDAYLITEKQARSANVKEIKAAAMLALSGGDAPKYTADDVDN